MSREPDLRSLRYALTLASELHFGRAAARHYIAAQAFGRRIRQLESDLGLTLFHRTSRRVTLTPAGERVLTRATGLLAALDHLADEAADAPPPDDTAPLRVGVLGFGAAERWSNLREAVRRQLPNLELAHVELDMANQYEAVRRGDVDIAVVHEVGPVDGLELLRVLTAPRVALLPARSPHADAAHLTTAELRTLTESQGLVGFTGGHPGLAEWTGLGRPSGPALRYPAALSAAVATTGRIGLHGAPAARFYPHPDVRFIPTDGPPCQVAIATRENDHHPGVTAFRRAAHLLAAA
ncbi:DNA-binding transcriptional LysR family regulator [Pseudonocardia eucalypti]|nr:DNA-binding transcriptional LysR family regulator [Pseudonocardia eucalypti]